jgi:hypothetical protein
VPINPELNTAVTFSINSPSQSPASSLSSSTGHITQWLIQNFTHPIHLEKHLPWYQWVPIFIISLLLIWTVSQCLKYLERERERESRDN